MSLLDFILHSMLIPDALLLHALPLWGHDPDGVTTPMLHEILEGQGIDLVWTKSVHRALQRLENVGAVVTEKRGRCLHWWRLSGSGAIGAQTHRAMNLDEALALRVLANSTQNHQLPWPVLPALQNLFEHAQQLLAQSPHGQAHRNWMHRVSWIDEGYARQAPLLVDPVARTVSVALFNTREILVKYRAVSQIGCEHDEPTEVVLQPLGWVGRAGLHYLVAQKHAGAPLRHYRIDRILSVKLGEAFHYPDDFSLQSHVQDDKAFDYPGTGEQAWIRLRFAHAWGRHLLETPVNETQRVLRETDAELEIEFLSWDSERLLWWIRSFGPYVQVIEPLHLRQRLSEEAQRSAALYAEPVNKEGNT